MDYESLCNFGNPVLFILYLYRHTGLSVKLGYASAIKILKLKKLNNPGGSCRIVLGMNAGLPLSLP